jgi:hypothetical protein
MGFVAVEGLFDAEESATYGGFGRCNNVGFKFLLREFNLEVFLYFGFFHL